VLLADCEQDQRYGRLERGGRQYVAPAFAYRFYYFAPDPERDEDQCGCSGADKHDILRADLTQRHCGERVDRAPGGGNDDDEADVGRPH
jgi:hypothetical protein